jgi:hypothetical protein
MEEFEEGFQFHPKDSVQPNRLSVIPAIWTTNIVKDCRVDEVMLESDELPVLDLNTGLKT